MSISDFFNYEFLFDSHCHLNSDDFFKDRAEVVDRAVENGIELVFDISTDVNSCHASVFSISPKFKNVKTFLGIDPEVFEPRSELYRGVDIEDDWFDRWGVEIERLINENREYVAGIGESGMDYYWIKDEDDEIKKGSQEMQRRLFEMHLDLGVKYNLPLSIHSRGAEKECLDIIKNYNCTGIFHSFTGSYEVAKGVLDAGWGLGVNGIVTFKNAKDLQETYKKILGKIPQAPQPSFFYSKGIFFETDAPYLSPEGKRGQRNEPANIKDIFEQFVRILNS